MQTIEIISTSATHARETAALLATKAGLPAPVIHSVTLADGYAGYYDKYLVSYSASYDLDIVRYQAED